MTTPSVERPEQVPIVTVAVELFGVPRLLTGCRVVEAAGATLLDLAANLAAQHPDLRGRVLAPESGWLLPGYTFVVDDQFTRDPATALRPGASVLLVSSVAGG